MITKPRQRSLAVKELLVDNYAQRTYNPAKAKSIADNWDERKIGVFQVSERSDGAYYVFDGQHRRGAMNLLEKETDKIEALVYKGLTIEEEAFLFLAYNADSTRPTPVDIFRLSVVAKDPAAVEILEVVRNHSLDVGYGGTNQIAAVAALRWVHEQGGAALLDQVLTIIEQAWSREAHEGGLIKGLAHFLVKTKRDRIDVDALAKKLGGDGTSIQLLGRARTFRGATGRALWAETAHCIATIYNKGRTARNRVTL